jgi:hypothetical protein
VPTTRRIDFAFLRNQRADVSSHEEINAMLSNQCGGHLGRVGAAILARRLGSRMTDRVYEIAEQLFKLGVTQ